MAWWCLDLHRCMSILQDTVSFWFTSIMAGAALLPSSRSILTVRPPKPRGRPGTTICYSLHVSGGKTPFVSLSLQRIRAWLPAWWINSKQSRRKIGQTGADMGFCIHKDDCRIKANLLREGKPCWPSATALPRHAAANRPTLCVCVCVFFLIALWMG